MIYSELEAKYIEMTKENEELKNKILLEKLNIDQIRANFEKKIKNIHTSF